mmetsp:Transcript_2571/g.2900  ORF Transcript_2571/g.2900 Transcript_2571/m.2900 type:complete len:97 (-) Transcript_2571:188-478(-)|eukprot:CAMPEP_0184023850 /NCGR_PEP_ID=MMETSP0954-20121128/11649_1 /TAXON_ID=627963 /ORGANISM="Aplanochytrium sp, Strain PBS07" /LENGTH=96 /DNA_ID=CAMNT_0026306899 /DNA_START=101 /DNA_END=391 /DNA_ORIENTATION=+
MSFLAKLDNVSRNMVYGIGAYAVCSFGYSSVKRVSAPKHEEPKHTPKAEVPAAPVAAAKPVAKPASPAALQSDDALAILKDVQSRVIKIEKIFNHS